MAPKAASDDDDDDDDNFRSTDHGSGNGTRSPAAEKVAKPRPTVLGTTPWLSSSTTPSGNRVAVSSPAPSVSVRPGLQFTAIINWWDSPPDSPSKVAERLGFAPNIGTFYDIHDSWDANRFKNEVDQIVAMRDKFKNLWTPIQMDVAILPKGGLPAFEALLPQIANSFRDAEQRGIHVRTRALTEMNGTWFEYSTGRYEEIKAILRKFYTVIKSVSASTIMWNPNFSFGGCGPDDPIDARNFDPGADFWDEAGLDIYVHGPKCQNDMPTGGEIRAGITGCDFYNYVKASGKPFLVAETSRATKIGCGTVPPDFDFQSKSNWLAQLFDPALKADFPLLYNVSWFDYNKFEDGEQR